MYTFELRFFPKSFEKPFIDEFDDDMQWFISALSKNGQILTSWQNTVKYSDYYACRVVTPVIDSLDEKYYNKYCRNFLVSVLEKSTKAPEFQIIGENYDVEDSCTCKSPTHYILYTTYISEESPIICGDCKKSVPLYKFPKTYDNEEYWDIQWWQRLYQACDTQFMGGVGERHGYKMMNDPKSELSKEGLRICSYLEERVKKPFYYYLHRYYTKNKPICPKCKESWINQNEKVQYDYVCNKCRLVSNDMK